MRDWRGNIRGVEVVIFDLSENDTNFVGFDSMDFKIQGLRDDDLVNEKLAKKSHRKNFNPFTPHNSKF